MATVIKKRSRHHECARCHRVRRGDEMFRSRWTGNWFCANYEACVKVAVKVKRIGVLS